MSAFHRLILLLFVAVASVATRRSHRARRSLLELAGAIKCSTGRSALSYMMYGCYCGLGGQGWPRDRTDCFRLLTSRPNHKRCAVAWKEGALSQTGRLTWSDGRFKIDSGFDCCRLQNNTVTGDVCSVWTYRCCHRHDCCYGDAEVLGCHTKTDRYQWTCEDKTAECDDLKDRCEKLLCQCDRDAARCLRKAPFIRKYAVWPDFLCGYKQPMCSIY